MAKQTLVVRKALQRNAGPKVHTGKGLTEQAHKQECDMNYILADYHRTGLLKHAARYKGEYDDFSEADFQTAMYVVTEAQQMFDQLPANMRKRFDNEPGKFLAFVGNSENEAEMRKLGILKGNDGINVKGAASGAPVEQSPPPPAAE